MKITELTEGIHQLSINVKDILFESLWEMPKGVTLNSYVVKGDKVAIIDGFCGWDGYPESLYALLDEMNIALESIEYLVLNHLEPDHAGWISDFMKVHNHFTVVCSDKGAEIFKAFFGASVPIEVVKDGQILSLGNGKALKFNMIPHVHWPDTMATLETSSGVLFSCDAYGSFGIIENAVFDDECDASMLEAYERETIRYYSNIIGAFSPFVLRANTRLESEAIQMIAPGHGLVWRSNPQKMFEDYGRYASYQKGPAREEITVLWGSMYGMTQEGVETAIETLKAEGIKVHVHNVPETPWGEILTSLWTSTGLVLAMPTYEYKMFPPMAAALEEIGKKKAQGKVVFRLGSYGWSGGAQKELDEIHERLKLNWIFLEPVEFKGKVDEEGKTKIKNQTLALIAEVKAKMKPSNE